MVSVRHGEENEVENSEQNEIEHMDEIEMGHTEDTEVRYSGAMQVGCREEGEVGLRKEVQVGQRKEVQVGHSSEVWRGGDRQLQGIEEEARGVLAVDESPSEDEDWEPCVKRENRTEEEYELAQLLDQRDEELFSVANEKQVQKYLSRKCLKDRKEQFGERYVKSRTNKELFEENSEINKYVIETEAFQERATSYSVRYYQDNYELETSAEILAGIPDAPETVQNSRIVKERLGHLTRKEKSDKVMLKSFKETFAALTVSNCKESREQKRILAASVTSLEYGVPDLGLSSREDKEVFNIKKKLISGEEKILKAPEKTVRQAFPPKVQEIALKHWEEITVVEPSKHRYVIKAVRDENETVPTRYQTMTNEESYESFKETCKNEVKDVMVKQSKEMTIVYEKRKDSLEKDTRIRYAQVPQSVLVARPAPQ